jgi:hypothetical protein
MIGLLILGASGPAVDTRRIRSGSGRGKQLGLATALGDVLASEDTCNLHYDQDAITKFVNAHVKADDMEFPSMLKAMTCTTPVIVLP